MSLVSIDRRRRYFLLGYHRVRNLKFAGVDSSLLLIFVPLAALMSTNVLKWKQTCLKPASSRARQNNESGFGSCQKVAGKWHCSKMCPLSGVMKILRAEQGNGENDKLVSIFRMIKHILFVSVSRVWGPCSPLYSGQSGFFLGAKGVVAWSWPDSCS